MATLRLPIGDSYDDTYSVNISGVKYDIRFRWIEFDQAWQCYLGESGQDPLITFKVLPGRDLLNPYFATITNLPKGVMLIVDTIEEDRPTFEGTGYTDGDQFQVFFDTI